MSRRSALQRTTGQWESWHECVQGKYSLEWYQDEIAKYGLNYVRHDVCNDLELMQAHLDWAVEKKIVVEWTLDGVGGNNNIEAIVERFGHHPNIIMEVFNEMYSDADVSRALHWANYLHERGVICSGGAIGAGGEEFCFKFFNERPPVDIIQTHRHWPYPGHEEDDWIILFTESEDPYFNSKPAGRNEFFDIKEHGLEIMEFIFKISLKHGAQLINYYGFRLPDIWGPCGVDKEGWLYWEILEFARDLLYLGKKKGPESETRDPVKRA